MLLVTFYKNQTVYTGIKGNVKTLSTELCMLNAYHGALNCISSLIHVTQCRFCLAGRNSILFYSTGHGARWCRAGVFAGSSPMKLNYDLKVLPFYSVPSLFQEN